LLERIHRRYRTTTEAICFASRSFSFTRIAEPDRVLDQIIADEDRREKLTGLRLADPPHLPYWAELWDSSRALAAVVARMDWPADKSALDLGCGMGLAGTAAAACGARVLLADLESPALLFARLNTLPYSDRARTRCLNWQRDRLDEKFDFVLGADIVYEKSQWEFLDAFWKSHLAKDGAILLAEPGRPSGDLFMPWMTDRGWELEQRDEMIAGRPTPIRIIQLRPARSRVNANGPKEEDD
jgi:predicted nicotinamide N-methyase